MYYKLHMQQRNMTNNIQSLKEIAKKRCHHDVPIGPQMTNLQVFQVSNIILILPANLPFMSPTSFLSFLYFYQCVPCLLLT